MISKILPKIFYTNPSNINYCDEGSSYFLKNNLQQNDGLLPFFGVTYKIKKTCFCYTAGL